MSNDDRVQRAFDDLRRQSGQIDLSDDFGVTRQLASVRLDRRSSWISALVAAAVMVVGVGAVLFFQRGGDSAPIGAGTDVTVVEEAVPEPAPSVPGFVYSAPDGQPTTNATTATTGGLTAPLVPTSPISGLLAEAGTGWRVTGVASDDVLNVRSGGGVGYEIVGALAYDDVDVVLSGWGATHLDGTGWWGVRLADGTEGFVNKRFLAPPASWLDGIAELECDVEPADDLVDLAVLTPSVPVSDASGIQGFAHVQVGACDRFVVILGSGEAFAPPSDANDVPPGVAIYSVEGEVVVDFAGAPLVRNVSIPATNDLFGSALVLTSVPGGSDISLAPRVHIFTSKGRASIQGVRFLSDPARIVVDVVGADVGSSEILYAEDGLTVILGLAVNDGGLVEVRGFARWFEAQGVAMLFDVDGNPYPASWTGWSVADGAFGHTAGVFAPWHPTWGEFAFDVEKIPPGAYTLFVGESCLVDEASDVWEDCGVTVEFTVR